MRNFKYFILSLLIIGLCASCNKEDDDIGLSNLDHLHLRSSSATIDSSIFGSNYLVPFVAAQRIAQKIDKTLPVQLRDSSPERAILNSSAIRDSLGQIYVYVFNYVDDGYIMISADERHDPIISLVSQGSYQTETVPLGLYNWLVTTLMSIDALKTGIVDNGLQARHEWTRLINEIDDPQLLPGPGFNDGSSDPGPGCGTLTTTSNGPLLTTRWNQDCGGFNNLCEWDECNGNILDCPANCSNNPPSGCVATAMAQILKYWAHPSSQGYNYSSMQNATGNGEVQRLMVDVGCSVDMVYGCGVSGAYQDKVAPSFKNDFGYSTADLNDWTSSTHHQVIYEINQNKPVILVGFDDKTEHRFIIKWGTSYSNGHAWDCDGYTRTANSCQNTTKFHMNWGWWGNHNGWYHYNTWDPPNSLDFQYAREFIHNIEP